MIFDYSNVTDRDFEDIALEYLRETYPESTWEKTERSGDGNRDAESHISISFTSQELWGEAKFQNQGTNRKLSKGQLDPTLLSAYLYHGHVSVCFVSNGDITAPYLVRLKEFELKSDVGIELALKDSFEKWLSGRQDLCKIYRIDVIDDDNKQISTLSCQAWFGTIGSDSLKIINSLVLNEEYYCYFVIKSPCDYKRVSIYSENEIKCVPGLQTLYFDNFSVEEGTHLYRFKVIPNKIFSGDAVFAVYIDTETPIYVCIKNISIKQDTSLKIAYAQQETILDNLIQDIRSTNPHNQAFYIEGDGASGKSYLFDNLYKELYETDIVYKISFKKESKITENNRKALLNIIILLYIGDVSSFDENTVMTIIEQVCDIREKFFFERILQAYYHEPKEGVDFLLDRIEYGDFPAVSTARLEKTILLVEDIHYLNSESHKLFLFCLSSFLSAENTQRIVISSRPGYNFDISSSNITLYSLNGLSRNDKKNTFSYYFKLQRHINFSEATKDIIVFSNILNKMLKKYGNRKLSLQSEALLVRSFEIVSDQRSDYYKNRLNEASSYFDILRIIFALPSGLPESEAESIISSDDFDFLCEKKLIKRIDNNIVPFHDLYIEAMESMAVTTPNVFAILEKLYKKNNNPQTRYQYLLAMVRICPEKYFRYADIVTEEITNYYKRTDYYRAYLLSRELLHIIDEANAYDKRVVNIKMMFAVSAGYFEAPKDVRDYYEETICLANTLPFSMEIKGIIYRCYSEIVNIRYWEENIDELEDDIDNYIDRMGEVTPEDPQELIRAYLNLCNRKMVVQLWQEKYKKADETYRWNLDEIERLNQHEYYGYLHMDYAKGLYVINPKQALSEMKKAQAIFVGNKNEYRREIDCCCEVEYLECLVNPLKSVDGLKCAVDRLRTEHYYELYVKGALKVAGLLILRGQRKDLPETENYIYYASYYMPYEQTGRLKRLYDIVEKAYIYFLNGKSITIDPRIW